MSHVRNLLQHLSSALSVDDRSLRQSLSTVLRSTGEIVFPLCRHRVRVVVPPFPRLAEIRIDERLAFFVTRCVITSMPNYFSPPEVRVDECVARLFNFLSEWSNMPFAMLQDVDQHNRLMTSYSLYTDAQCRVCPAHLHFTAFTDPKTNENYVTIKDQSEVTVAVANPLGKVRQRYPLYAFLQRAQTGAMRDTFAAGLGGT